MRVLQDMRTYVALSNQTVAAGHTAASGSQEVWGYWPDDEPMKGLHPGDTRAALTPFLAHEVCLRVSRCVLGFSVIVT